MASIAFKNVDGSTLSRVKILKDGRALEVNPPTKKTWPSMDAWVQEMPREWPRVEGWTPPTAVAEGPPLHVRPQLAYFLGLPEGATTSNRETIRATLASYMERYMWLSCHVFWKVHDLKPAHPLYHLDDFLVTLTGLDPRGIYTARQILNALLARQTRKVAASPVEEAPAPVEEAPAPVEEAPVAVEEAPAPVEEAPASEAAATFQSRVVMHLSHVITQLAEKLRATSEIGTLCINPGPLSDSTRERILHLALFGV